MATITSENSKQIRNVMDVYVHFFAGSSASISSYSANTYKTYDSTLANTSWNMRNVADLANGGFPLDGTCSFYDSNTTSSAANGKMGLRGTTGSNSTVTITASSALTTITIASENVDTITCNGTSYESTGLNVIPVNSATATLVFTPADSDSRIMVNYIVPGAEFSITNDNLVSCNLALRSNLEVKDNTWQESEIEVSMYYPYDISNSFAYIQSDWPITYQAGYDSDLSEERKFYLSEPITQENNVITIHGVDASHLLEKKTINERWFKVRTDSVAYYPHWMYFADFVSVIKSAGIELEYETTGYSVPGSGSYQYTIIPEMTARDYVANFMLYTIGTNWPFIFVDAGIPKVYFGSDATDKAVAWNIRKSDCADWAETYEQHLAAIRNTNDTHKFRNQFFALTGSLPGGRAVAGTYEGSGANQFIDVSLDGYYEVLLQSFQQSIVVTPTSAKIKHTRAAKGEYKIFGYPYSDNGGFNNFANPDGLPGYTLEIEPFIWGDKAVDDINGDMVIDYESLFNRSLRTGTFKFKGDPRIQPLDYLLIVNDTNDGRGDITARITSIEMEHSEGGTTAVIGWREWNDVTIEKVLIDDKGRALVTDSGKALLIGS